MSLPPGSGNPLGGPPPDLPVFVISVAAELTGLHPQTLRAYDRLGLVRPGRAGEAVVGTHCATWTRCESWPG